MAQISFSQFSTWATCPQSWKLKYIDKIKDQDNSIYAIFGSAMHTVIQHYLNVMYTETIKKSNAIDFEVMLKEEMLKEYNEAIASNPTPFSSPAQLTEFYNNGIKILNYLRKKRMAYYSTKNVELVGIEIPLDAPIIDSHPGVTFRGYLDFVWKDNDLNTITIDDFKTSYRGWNDKAKKNKIKTSQLLLYKEFYAKQFNVPVDNIKIRYVILKQNIWEEAEFPIPRIQIFKPADGSVSRNKIKKIVTEFITECFQPDGEYRMDTIHTPAPSKDNCKWCPFKNRKDLCSVGIK